MKQIKLLSMMLLLGTMFFGFSACSDDDGNDNNNNNSGDNSKKVTKVVNEYSNGIRTETFSYSSGKLSKYTAKYNSNTGYENNQTIIYKENTVLLKGLFDGNDCEQTYTLNSDGLAISCKLVDNDENWVGNYTFQYSDGYLTHISYLDDDPDYNMIWTFTYSNGNMTKATWRDKWDNDSYTFTYTNNLNKANILNEFIGDDMFVHRAAFYAGILGKATKNLPKSNGQANVVYSLDNDGYVITANIIGTKFTFFYE